MISYYYCTYLSPVLLHCRTHPLHAMFTLTPAACRVARLGQIIPPPNLATLAAGCSAGNAAAILERSSSGCVAAEQTGCRALSSLLLLKPADHRKQGPGDYFSQVKCNITCKKNKKKHVSCIIATCMTFSAKKPA